MVRAFPASPYRFRLAPRRRSGLVVAALALLALAFAPSALAQCDQAGCGYDTCRVGIEPVPSPLWGDLEPAELGALPGGKGVADGRDASGFDEFREGYSSRNWYMGVRSSGGYIFQGLAHGISIWQPGPNGPGFVGKMLFGAFPHPAVGENGKWPIVGIGVPEGRHDVALLTGAGGMGVSIVDATFKPNPTVAFQDSGFDAQDAHATQLGNVAYGVAATAQGIRIYNMDAALACPSKTSCPGVFVGSINQPSSSLGGTGRYLALGRLPNSLNGVTIYDLANPAAPLKKLELATASIPKDVEMWSAGSKTYLAVRLGTTLDIYDASCLSGTCGGLDRVGGASGLFDYGSQFLTLSKDGGRTYLYSGTDNRCGWNSARNPVQQMEYLFDVTNPSAPFDMTPATEIVNGAEVGYWGWYYRANPSGFNYIAPRGGVVAGGQLHRAALGLYDVHRLTGGQPPAAAFGHPTPIYAGTAATFVDNSTGGYDIRSWSFQDGSPANSAAANPSVTFASPGPKQVILTVSGSLGQDTQTKLVPVIDPAPNAASIGISPAAPKQCQPVTLTANASGKPPLGYGWSVLDGAQAAAGSVVGSGASVVWNTAGLGPGTYTANVVVNGVGSDSVSQPITLAPLTPLPAASFPLLAPPAFPAATVQLSAGVAGATEWSWDFGDGNGFGPWSNDPVTGPNPVHSYQTTGLKNVRVQVRNCVETTPVVSAPLAIQILQVAPLEAGFQASGIFCTRFGCSAEAGTAIAFDDLSNGSPLSWSYDWDATSATCGAGNSFEDVGHTTPVTSHTYSAAGTYFPCQRVSRGVEHAYHGHSAITIGSPQPASISVSGPSSGTPGQNLAFSASASNCTASPDGWSWTVSGGTIAGADDGGSISVSWSSNGTKNVRATNTGCGSTSGSKNVSISSSTPPPPPPPPSGNVTAAFSIAPTTSPAGQPVAFNASASTGDIGSYGWSFGDGTTGGGKTVTHTYAQPGNYTVELTVGKSGCLSAGCFVSTTKSITITPGGGGPPPPPPPPPGSVAAAFQATPGNPSAGQAVTFDASTSTGDISFYEWTFGDGATGSGKVISHSFDQPGTYSVTLDIGKSGCLSAGCFSSVTKAVTVGSGPPVGTNGCTGDMADDVDKLCLGEGRYIVEVDWENHHAEDRPIGEGRFRRLGGSESTGFFWFFNPDSIDLIVKIIDGSVVNEHVWVFYGALTDVIYDLEITDTLTGQSKTYKNAEGSICGRGDTAAFATAGLTAPASATGAASAGGGLSHVAGEAVTEELLLLDGRFKVTVDWENHHVPTGTPRTVGTGRSVTGTDGSGYFYFFEPSSLDLVVKMIDAREFDGHFWVFYGGLSDVKYSLQIEDLVTGETWEKVNPTGSICGGSDTAAFTTLGD